MSQQVEFIDTHCHIHGSDYSLGGEIAYQRSIAEGVSAMICVGTDEQTSAEAVIFATDHDNCWASVGLHPHDALHGAQGIREIRSLLEADSETGTIVAIGECGLDYFYDNSPRDKQIEMLHAQIGLAIEFDKPIIFHVRDAFDDFWPIFESYKDLRGVLHSFTDTAENMEKAVTHGLYIGVNGISTFTKSESQREMFRTIPLGNLVFETDAPFLTPVPMRGTVNEPAFVMHVARFHADLRQTTLQELSVASCQNATTLFSLIQNKQAKTQ